MTAFFAAVTALLTWPQVAQLNGGIAAHQDALFSVWRIAWVAHALPRGDVGLFNANIFFPNLDTLAYSDPTLLQGALATPFIALGMPLVAAYNTLVLGSFVVCGVATFYLLRRLVRSAPAASLAGALVFVFAPYKLDHYMHLELLWAPWMPIAVMAMEALFTTGQLRWGLLLGLALIGQLTSGMYYAVFLVTTLTLLAALLLAMRRDHIPRALVGLVLGALIGVGTAVPLAQPFLRARTTVGDRGVEEIARYSATPSNYLGIPPNNRFYGSLLAQFGESERMLSPGMVAVLLAIVGVLTSPAALRIPYGALLLFAFAASLGDHTPVYRVLHSVVPGYAQLRVPARFHIVVLLCLSVFVAQGVAELLRRLETHRAVALAEAAILIALCVEYATTPHLMQVSPRAPAVYSWLRTQAPAPVLELPVPGPSTLPGRDPWYQFHSTAHWFPLVNGSSGFYPPSYLKLLEKLKTFPQPGWLEEIDRLGIRYLIVHAEHIAPIPVESVLVEIVASKRRTLVGPFKEDGSVAWVAVLVSR